MAAGGGRRGTGDESKGNPRAGGPWPEAEPDGRVYEEHPPAAGHDAWMWSAWRFRIVSGQGPVFHVIPPDGTVSISIGSPGSGLGEHLVVLGPHLRPRTGEIHPGSWWIGIRVWPGAAPGLLDVPVESLRDQSLPLADVAPDLAQELRAREWDASDRSLALLETLIAGRYCPDRADARVVAASRCLFETGGRATVGALAHTVSLSPRQLRRRFRTTAGVAPKELARALRARAASVAMLETELDLGPPSHRAGYADQAHMVRDFRSVLGPVPGEVRANLKDIRHGWVRKP